MGSAGSEISKLIRATLAQIISLIRLSAVCSSVPSEIVRTFVGVPAYVLSLRVVDSTGFEPIRGSEGDMVVSALMQWRLLYRISISCFSFFNIIINDRN